MIEIISGPPGGGKSYLAVTRVIEELDSGRHVVTNLALTPKVASKYPKLRIVPHDDVTDIVRPGVIPQGAFVCIDEAPVYWPATGNRDQVLLEFTTQHRKLGLDVWLVCISPELVHKAWRDTCQHLVTVRNLGYGLGLGMGVPGRHIASRYLRISTQRMEWWSFSRRKEVQDSYLTTAGANFVGAKADVSRSYVKDLRKWGPPIMLGVIGAMWLLQWGVGESVRRYLADPVVKLPAGASGIGTNAPHALDRTFAERLERVQGREPYDWPIVIGMTVQQDGQCIWVLEDGQVVVTGPGTRHRNPQWRRGVGVLAGRWVRWSGSL